MNKVPYKTIGTKVKYETAGIIMQLAGKSGLTVSTYLKNLIDREISGIGVEKNTTLDALVYEKEIKEAHAIIKSLKDEIKKIKKDAAIKEKEYKNFNVKKRELDNSLQMQKNKNSDLMKVVNSKENEIKELIHKARDMQEEIKESVSLLLGEFLDLEDLEENYIEPRMKEMLYDSMVSEAKKGINLIVNEIQMYKF